METCPLDNVVIVLDEPKDVVNVAGVVRVMMNMGLSRLRLVSPDDFDTYRIGGIAHRSEELTGAAETFETLQDALSDMVLSVGTSARPRTDQRNYVRPREVAPRIVEGTADGLVALVFGREDRGLTNDGLDLCHSVAIVPTAAEYPSLNLAQACLVLRYKPYRQPYVQEAQWPRLLVVTTINDEVFIRWLHHHAWGALAAWGKGPLLEPVVVKQEGFQRVPVVLPLAPPYAEEPTRPSPLPPVGRAFHVSLDIPLEYPPEAAADLGRASTQYGRELARRMGYDMPHRLRGSGLLRNAPKLRLDEEVLGPNEIGKMVDAIYGELDLDGDRKRQNLVESQRHRAKKLLKGDSGQV